MKTLRTSLGIAVFTALAAMSASANAEIINLSAELSGQNEVPPNDTSATGVAEATFDTDNNMVTWNIVFEGLTGPVVGMHLHGPAEPSANAGIAVAIEGPLSSPVEGGTTLNDDQAKALLDGALYVNIHTAAHPGGELRGHLVQE